MPIALQPPEGFVPLSPDSVLGFCLAYAITISASSIHMCRVVSGKYCFLEGVDHLWPLWSPYLLFHADLWALGRAQWCVCPIRTEHFSVLVSVSWVSLRTYYFYSRSFSKKQLETFFFLLHNSYLKSSILLKCFQKGLSSLVWCFLIWSQFKVTTLLFYARVLAVPCVCMVCVLGHVCIWKSEDSIVESCFSCLLMGSRV